MKYKDIDTISLHFELFTIDPKNGDIYKYHTKYSDEDMSVHLQFLVPRIGEIVNVAFALAKVIQVKYDYSHDFKPTITIYAEFIDSFELLDNSFHIKEYSNDKRTHWSKEDKNGIIEDKNGTIHLLLNIKE